MESQTISEFQLSLEDLDYSEEIFTGTQKKEITSIANQDNESDEVFDEKKFADANPICTNKEKKIYNEQNKFKNEPMNINSSREGKTSQFLGHKRKNGPKNGVDEFSNGKKTEKIEDDQEDYDDCLGKSTNEEITLKNDLLNNLESIIKLLKTTKEEISSSEFRNIKKENENHYKEELLAKIEKKKLDKVFFLVFKNCLNGPIFEEIFSEYKTKDDIKDILMKLIKQIKNQKN